MPNPSLLPSAGKSMPMSELQYAYIYRLLPKQSLATTPLRWTRKTWSDLQLSTPKQWRPTQSQMQLPPTISTCPTSTPSSSPSPLSYPCHRMKYCAKGLARSVRCCSWCKPTRYMVQNYCFSSLQHFCLLSPSRVLSISSRLSKSCPEVNGGLNPVLTSMSLRRLIISSKISIGRACRQTSSPRTSTPPPVRPCIRATS